MRPAQRVSSCLFSSARTVAVSCSFPLTWSCCSPHHRSLLQLHRAFLHPHSWVQVFFSKNNYVLLFIFFFTFIYCRFMFALVLPDCQIFTLSCVFYVCVSGSWIAAVSGEKLHLSLITRLLLHELEPWTGHNYLTTQTFLILIQLIIIFLIWNHLSIFF